MVSRYPNDWCISSSTGFLIVRPAPNGYSDISVQSDHPFLSFKQPFTISSREIYMTTKGLGFQRSTDCFDVHLLLRATIWIPSYLRSLPIGYHNLHSQPRAHGVRLRVSDHMCNFQH